MYNVAFITVKCIITKLKAKRGPSRGPLSNIISISISSIGNDNTINVIQYELLRTIDCFIVPCILNSLISLIFSHVAQFNFTYETFLAKYINLWLEKYFLLKIHKNYDFKNNFSIYTFLNYTHKKLQIYRITIFFNLSLDSPRFVSIIVIVKKRKVQYLFNIS